MSRDDWDPDLYARNAGYVIELGQDVLELLAARRGERVLDLGCGEGTLTRRLADFGCEVVAVDSSPAQVAAARSRGLDARIGDAHDLGFSHQFDAVFSNAALHWMREPDRVVSGVFRALRPGGRFVGEFGGAGNIRAILGALRGAFDRRGRDFDRVDPWYFPSAESYRGVLESAGFEVERIELFERPTPIPGDLIGWLEVFGAAIFAGLSAEERLEILREVRDAARPALRDVAGEWRVDYVRLRFVARRP